MPEYKSKKKSVVGRAIDYLARPPQKPRKKKKSKTEVRAALKKESLKARSAAYSQVLKGGK